MNMPNFEDSTWNEMFDSECGMILRGPCRYREPQQVKRVTFIVKGLETAQKDMGVDVERWKAEEFEDEENNG